MLKSFETNQLLRIDSHAHVFLESLTMLEGRRYSPNYDASSEEYFNLLKSENLDGGLLVQPSFLGTDNNYLLKTIEEAKQKEPQLLVKGVAVVKPTITLEEMSALKSSGITGIRLNCISRAMPEFDSSIIKSFLKRVDSLGWHVEIQIEGGRLNAALGQLLLTNSRIVIDHFGLPDTSDNNINDNLIQLLNLNNSEQEICVKISAPYRVHPELSLDQSVKKCCNLTAKLLESLSQENLIWGSDWPWTQHQKGQSYKDTVEWANQWISSQDYTPGHVPDWLMNP